MLQTVPTWNKRFYFPHKVRLISDYQSLVTRPTGANLWLGTTTHSRCSLTIIRDLISIITTKIFLGILIVIISMTEPTMGYGRWGQLNCLLLRHGLAPAYHLDPSHSHFKDHQNQDYNSFLFLFFSSCHPDPSHSIFQDQHLHDHIVVTLSSMLILSSSHTSHCHSNDHENCDRCVFRQIP